ncbi:MAG: hypothetical protein LBS55_05350 [Prevotellaceae bacterium]|nr:hypothetical protein [Prevotellaceae bacterium]
MASPPLGGQKPAGITNGTRITATAVRLADEATNNHLQPLLTQFPNSLIILLSFAANHCKEDRGCISG